MIRIRFKELLFMICISTIILNSCTNREKALSDGWYYLVSDTDSNHFQKTYTEFLIHNEYFFFMNSPDTFYYSYTPNDSLCISDNFGMNCYKVINLEDNCFWLEETSFRKVKFCKLKDECSGFSYIDRKYNYYYKQLKEMGKNDLMDSMIKNEYVDEILKYYFPDTDLHDIQAPPDIEVKKSIHQ